MFLPMFFKTQNIGHTMHLTMLIAHPYLCLGTFDKNIEISIPMMTFFLAFLDYRTLSHCHIFLQIKKNSLAGES